MFAKVYNTISRALSRSPSVQGRPEGSREDTPRSNDPETDMVSTRRGPVEERQLRSSARKGKRTLEAEETPATSKRRRRSVAAIDEVPTQVEEFLERVNDADEEYSDSNSILDTIAVQSKPKIDYQTQEQEDKLPIRRRASPKVVVARSGSPPVEVEKHRTNKFPDEIPSSTQETQLDTPVTHRPSSTHQTPAEARPEQEDSPTPKADATSARRTPRSNKKNRRSEKSEKNTTRQDGKVNEQGDAVLNTPNVVDSASPMESKKEHIRFGSEEPSKAEEPIDTQVQTQNSAQDNALVEDESDSDEGPEEVTAAFALSKSKAAEAETTRAIEAQKENEKLKRKERADRVAEEQEQKRKREAKRAKKLAKLETKENVGDLKESLDVDIRNPPALLPDSILDAAGDRRPPTPPRVLPGISAVEKREAKLKRHIKFLERGERSIKDVRKGSLNIHVLAQENAFLAPKVNKDTKNVRERWLKGREVEKRQGGKRRKMEFKKMERRPVARGFLRGDD